MASARPGPKPQRGRGGHVMPLLGAVALAVVVGVLTALHFGLAAAVVSAIALSALLVPSSRLSRPVDLGGKRFRWLAFAWVYVLIRPIGHYTAGRTQLTAVAGVPSWENVADVGTHAAILALTLWSLRSNRFPLRAPWLILALPALSLVSAAWSLAPTVTLGFSFELVVICLLAMLTVAIDRTDPELARSVLRQTLRLVVVVVAALCVIGLLFPHGSGTLPGDNRFHWPGENPLPAAAEIGSALLLIVFAGRDEIGFSRPSRVALAVLFGACLYLGQVRTAFAGLAVAALFGYWFTSRGRGWLRRLAGTAAIGMGALLVVSSFGGAITQYLYRGQTQQTVLGLDGRLGVWSFAVQQLHTPTQWLFGYGLSGDRVLLASNISWAGDAHGAWVELLLSLGLVGLAVGVAVVAVVAARLLRTAPHAAFASRILPVLFVYVLAMSPVATGFAAPGPEPALGFSLLALGYAMTATRRRAAAPAPATPFIGDLRPLPV